MYTVNISSKVCGIVMIARASVFQKVGMAKWIIANTYIKIAMAKWRKFVQN